MIGQKFKKIFGRGAVDLNLPLLKTKWQLEYQKIIFPSDLTLGYEAIMLINGKLD